MSAAPEPEVPGLVGQSSEAGPLYTWQPRQENWTAANLCVRKGGILTPMPMMAVGSGGGKGELSEDSEVLGRCRLFRSAVQLHSEFFCVVLKCF